MVGEPSDQTYLRAPNDKGTGMDEERGPRSKFTPNRAPIPTVRHAAADRGRAVATVTRRSVSYRYDSAEVLPPLQ